jgi:hypothetical protein
LTLLVGRIETKASKPRKRDTPRDREQQCPRLTGNSTYSPMPVQE